jgi:ABC-type transport system substrate-binding protein
MDGYDESLGQPVYDPTRAKELLANSTYDGRSFELLVTGTTAQFEQLAMTLMDMLVSVGFSMEVTLETSTNLITRTMAGDYDVFLNQGSFTDGLIQRQVTKILVDSDKTLYQSEELLSYVKGYLTEVNADKREEYAKLINKYVTEEKAPHINLMHRSQIHAQNYGITGIRYAPDGYTNYIFADWDPSLLP